MIRANLTSILALARPMRMVPVEEFDLMVGELEELRKRDRERVDLAYQERAAVVAFVRGARLDDFADAIERGEHRRGEGA